VNGTNAMAVVVSLTSLRRVLPLKNARCAETTVLSVMILLMTRHRMPAVVFLTSVSVPPAVMRRGMSIHGAAGMRDVWFAAAA